MFVSASRRRDALTNISQQHLVRDRAKLLHRRLQESTTRTKTLFGKFYQTRCRPSSAKTFPPTAPVPSLAGMRRDGLRTRLRRAGFRRRLYSQDASKADESATIIG